jgi:hypothetical protein
MPGPQQKNPPRQFQLSIDGSGNVAGVSIARVGNDTSNRLARRSFGAGSERGDLPGEFRRIIGIKTAGDGGQAKHQICHPSFLKTASAAAREVLAILARRMKS